MPTRHDLKLIELLESQSNKWGARMSLLTRDAEKGLTRFFVDAQKNKRLALLGFLDSLDVDANGFIVDSGKNRAELAKAMRGMRVAGVTEFGPDSSFAKYVDRQYNRAAKLGVSHTKAAYRLGEGKRLPRGFSPPTAGIVTQARGTLLRHLVDRTDTDVKIVRDSVLRRVFDPTGNVPQLRADLLRRGQLEGMLDSAGRRITASERADRIARFEFPEVSTRAHQKSVDGIYNDGKQDPKNTWYLWNQIQDGRKSKSHFKRHGEVLTEFQWATKSWGDKQKGLPPTRPRCRCNATHVRPEWFSKDTREKVFNAQTGLSTTVQDVKPSKAK
jgi:hypothetical protein